MRHDNLCIRHIRLLSTCAHREIELIVTHVDIGHIYSRIFKLKYRIIKIMTFSLRLDLFLSVTSKTIIVFVAFNLQFTHRVFSFTYFVGGI